MQANLPVRPDRPLVQLLTAVGLLTVTLAACGSSAKESSTTSSTKASSTTSSTASSSTIPALEPRFTIYLVADEHVVAAGRETSGSASAERAVRSLLLGPQGDIERNLGYTSAIPAGTTLRSVAVADKVATVDLSSEFASGGGSLSMQERVAQVVFTLTQFPNIERVRFRIDGKPAETIGGEGLMVNDVDRAAFTNVTPKILVETPTPGEVVRSPLPVRGMSNTFEATVNYTITDSDRAVLAHGFTTATAGTGTWGTFAVDVKFTAKKPGLGRLAVYEISPKDGSRVNETSVPIRLP